MCLSGGKIGFDKLFLRARLHLMENCLRDVKTSHRMFAWCFGSVESSDFGQVVAVDVSLTHWWALGVM